MIWFCKIEKLLCAAAPYLCVMKIEIEMTIGEKDESLVMEKVSQIVQQAKELGFAVEEIELKNKEEDDEEKEEEEGEGKQKKKGKKDKKRKH